jgi:serine/threonine protein phosphatase PrpC
MVNSRFGSAWRVVSASVAGPNHASTGLENQDAMRCCPVGDGLHLMAVADGAGSQPRAAHGSRLSVDAALDAANLVFARRPGTPAEWRVATRRYAQECLGFFDEMVDRMIVPASNHSPAGRSRVEARAEFATTLLAVVADSPYFAYVCVGDGFLVLDRDPGGPHLVVPPPSDRQTSSETVFLTSPGREHDVRSGLIVDGAVCGLALCTDGLIDGMLDLARSPDGTDRAFAPADFAAYFRAFGDPSVDASELGRKLQSKEFAASSGDDKTMVMAVRR